MFVRLEKKNREMEKELTREEEVVVKGDSKGDKGKVLVSRLAR